MGLMVQSRYLCCACLIKVGSQNPGHRKNEDRNQDLLTLTSCFPMSHADISYAKLTEPALTQTRNIVSMRQGSVWED